MRSNLSAQSQYNFPIHDILSVIECSFIVKLLSKVRLWRSRSKNSSPLTERVSHQNASLQNSVSYPVANILSKETPIHQGSANWVQAKEPNYLIDIDSYPKFWKCYYLHFTKSVGFHESWRIYDSSILLSPNISTHTASDKLRLLWTMIPSGLGKYYSNS